MDLDTDLEKLYAPATERNREAILAVLTEVLPQSGLVLEIASGTGQHIAFLAPRLSPELTWQPSDISPAHLRSIAAWCREAGTVNVRPPVQIDIGLNWSSLTVERPVAILCINLIHISPWSACLGLLAMAGECLLPGGVLYLYGPFRRDGRHTAASNESFDQMLKMENSTWGVRDLETVVAAAHEHGLALDEVVTMPANNLSVLFRREAAGSPGIPTITGNADQTKPALD